VRQNLSGSCTRPYGFLHGPTFSGCLHNFVKYRCLSFSTREKLTGHTKNALESWKKAEFLPKLPQYCNLIDTLMVCSFDCYECYTSRHQMHPNLDKNRGATLLGWGGSAYSRGCCSLFSWATATCSPLHAPLNLSSLLIKITTNYE
jgi:hypothetical protein